MSPDVSEVLERVRAIATDVHTPLKERLDAVIEIAEALEEHEDQLTLSVEL
jgi:hypothetical protein